MTPLILPPHPALQPYIRHYAFTITGVAGKWRHAEIAPPGFNGLTIIMEGKDYRIKVNEEPVQTYESPAFIGQITYFSDILLYDRLKLFMVIFTPCGAYQLLGIDQHECRNSCFNLSDILGIPAKTLGKKLAEQTTVDGVRHIVESFFIKRLPLLKKKEISYRLSRVSEMIRLNSHNNDLLKEIRRKEGYSSRALERQMKEIVGISPKQYQRIVRFNMALQYINQHGHHCHWAQVASRFGYYDQAHFIKEFRFFYGRTPATPTSEDWIMRLISHASR